MNFSQKKLTQESLSRLYRVKVETIKPFALMLAPVYLFLRANEKFISVKAPLDFFTSEDLARLKSYDYFYLPECTSVLMPFREAALRVRRLLTTTSGGRGASEGSLNFPTVALPLAPYELSNEILRAIGPLWWEYSDSRLGIEPFLVTVFANELCDLLPSEQLLHARDKDTVNYDRALLRSSWAVFLALHLGYCDLPFLNQLRQEVFSKNLNGISKNSWLNEIEELALFAGESVNEKTRLLTQDLFKSREDRIFQKITARMDRIRSELAGRGENPPTLYGEGGFIAA